MALIKSLPDAITARQLTNNATNTKIHSEWKMLTDVILDAIDNGKTSMSGSGSLFEENILRLENKGYNYSKGSQYNESYYSISW